MERVLSLFEATYAPPVIRLNSLKLGDSLMGLPVDATGF